MLGCKLGCKPCLPPICLSPLVRHQRGYLPTRPESTLAPLQVNARRSYVRIRHHFYGERSVDAQDNPGATDSVRQEGEQDVRTTSVPRRYGPRSEPPTFAARGFRRMPSGSDPPLHFQRLRDSQPEAAPSEQRPRASHLGQTCTVLTPTPNSTSLRALLDHLPVLQLDALPRTPQLVFLLTPAYAASVVNDSDAFSHCIARIFPSHLASSISLPVLIAVVDRLPRPSPAAINHVSRSAEHRNKNPSLDDLGSEGLAFAYTDIQKRQDAPNENVNTEAVRADERPPVLGTRRNAANFSSNMRSANLTFELMPFVPSHPDLAYHENQSSNTVLHLQMPLATTIFANGLASTLLSRRYHLHSASARCTMSDAQNLDHFNLILPFLPDDLKFRNMALSTPLLCLTKARQVAACMGNIIRLLHPENPFESEGFHSPTEPVPASQELEAAVSSYFKLRNEPQRAVQVWALVIPRGQVQAVTRDNPVAFLSPSTKQLKHSWTQDPPHWLCQTVPSLYRTFLVGAKMCKVLSGGGGWGKKAGLLSLDPDSAYGRPENSLEEDAFFARESSIVEATDTPPLGEIARAGDFVQFYIAPTVSPSNNMADQALRPSIRRPTEQSIDLGVIPSTVDSLPTFAEPADGNQETRVTQVYHNHFGALSESGLALTVKSILPDQTELVGRRNGTKLDVPFTRFSVWDRRAASDQDVPDSNDNDHLLDDAGADLRGSFSVNDKDAAKHFESAQRVQKSGLNISPTKPMSIQVGGIGDADRTSPRWMAKMARRKEKKKAALEEGEELTKRAIAASVQPKVHQRKSVSVNNTSVQSPQRSDDRIGVDGQQASSTRNLPLTDQEAVAREDASYSPPGAVEKVERTPKIKRALKFHKIPWQEAEQWIPKYTQTLKSNREANISTAMKERLELSPHATKVEVTCPQPMASPAALPFSPFGQTEQTEIETASSREVNSPLQKPSNFDSASDTLRARLAQSRKTSEYSSQAQPHVGGDNRVRPRPIALHMTTADAIRPSPPPRKPLGAVQKMQKLAEAQLTDVGSTSTNATRMEETPRKSKGAIQRAMKAARAEQKAQERWTPQRGYIPLERPVSRAELQQLSANLRTLQNHARSRRQAVKKLEHFRQGQKYLQQKKLKATIEVKEDLQKVAAMLMPLKSEARAAQTAVREATRLLHDAVKTNHAARQEGRARSGNSEDVPAIRSPPYTGPLRQYQPMGYRSSAPEASQPNMPQTKPEDSSSAANKRDSNQGQRERGEVLSHRPEAAQPTRGGRISVARPVKTRLQQADVADSHDNMMDTLPEGKIPKHPNPAIGWTSRAMRLARAALQKRRKAVQSGQAMPRYVRTESPELSEQLTTKGPTQRPRLNEDPQVQRPRGGVREHVHKTSARASPRLKMHPRPLARSVLSISKFARPLIRPRHVDPWEGSPRDRRRSLLVERMRSRKEMRDVRFEQNQGRVYVAEELDRRRRTRQAKELEESVAALLGGL